MYRVEFDWGPEVEDPFPTTLFVDVWAGVDEILTAYSGEPVTLKVREGSTLLMAFNMLAFDPEQ